MTPINTIAITQSTIAMQQAHAANMRSCEAYIKTFRSENASITEMQSYAECVRMVYPNVEITASEIMFLKVILVIAFLGLFVGAWKGYKEDGLESALLLGIVGFLTSSMIAITAIGISYAFLWLVGVV
jgi:hypothetical protein